MTAATGLGTVDNEEGDPNKAESWKWAEKVL